TVAELVAIAVLEAVTAARRSEELAASEEMAARAATAGAWSSTPRSAAMAARPVIPERAALVATLLADRPALAVTAALAGRLMAALRLVAMAVVEAVTAARRLVERGASGEMAGMVAVAEAWWWVA